MTASYRLIDYRLRPSKHAERLMLCEAFRHLRFHVLQDYQYVGLGSIFFADFRLVHRILGISRMFSIENQLNDSDRFEWNKPYSGINLLFGETEQRLSDIEFALPTIIWLDYDGPLSLSVISDIRTVSYLASHGSILVVTVNAQPRRKDENGSDMLDQIRAELGNQKIPPQITIESLRGWGLARIYRQIGSNEIRDTLAIANSVRESTLQIEYEQLFNFQYKDGARMATFGGVFFERERRDQLESCAFDRLMFIRHGAEAFRIDSPLLTLREIAYLERQLPLAEDSGLDYGPMPVTDANRFIRLYRYLPMYLPVELL